MQLYEYFHGLVFRAQHAEVVCVRVPIPRTAAHVSRLLTSQTKRKKWQPFVYGDGGGERVARAREEQDNANTQHQTQARNVIHFIVRYEQ